MTKNMISWVQCLLPAVLLFMAVGFAHAQQSITVEPENERRYAKVVITQNGLHCPFLGSALKEKLKNRKEFYDLYIASDDKFISFSYPVQLNLDSADIAQIAVDVGYPSRLVRVTISNKPFAKQDTEE